MKRLTFSDLMGLTSIALILLLARVSTAEEDKALRVATLLPFVEDALTLAPDRVQLVASVRRSMHHPLAEGLVDLGNPHSPNFENLAAARPELIIGDRGVHAAIAPRLRSLGAEVRLINTTGIDATLAALAEIAAAVGETPMLDRRISEVQKALSELSVESPSKVLALFGAPGTFYAFTDRAWLGQLVDELGFENLAPSEGDERFPGLVVVSDEIISTMKPDIVVLVAHGDPRAIRADLMERTRSGGAWSSLQSAGQGIHVLNPALFGSNPGLDLDRAARELLALASGDAAATRAGMPNSRPSVSAGPAH